MQLSNKVNKEELKKRLMAESFKRITLSLYKYVIFSEPESYRNHLWKSLNDLGCFGRIYIAHEGINAQMNVPEHNWLGFVDFIENDPQLKGIRLNIAFDDDGKSFYKLTIKVRPKIVADGLPDDTFDVTNVGKHLNAEEFNQALESENTIVVDMRNHYESEVGRFEKAITPDADTFREELPLALNLLKGKEDKKLLLYCTGGIRCEKASAYFKHHGFQDVNQLYGGIIHYAKEIKEKNLSSKFKGKNFVFDERIAERVTDDILSECHQCGAPCDQHTNCANDECHLLFIQCENCKNKMQACCTPRCQDIFNLPEEEQIKLRKGVQKEDSLAVYKSRLRPNLKDIIAENKSQK